LILDLAAEASIDLKYFADRFREHLALVWCEQTLGRQSMGKVLGASKLFRGGTHENLKSVRMAIIPRGLADAPSAFFGP
jgi:hypothetical protein